MLNKIINWRTFIGGILIMYCIQAAADELLKSYHQADYFLCTIYGLIIIVWCLVLVVEGLKYTKINPAKLYKITLGLFIVVSTLLAIEALANYIQTKDSKEIIKLALVIVTLLVISWAEIKREAMAKEKDKK